MAPLGERRLERERVLTLLYEAEMKSESMADIIESLPAPPTAFTIECALGISDELSDLDALVGRFAKEGWDVDRMAVVDRTVLRFGAWELLHKPDLPVAVVITEAVELAKRFSTEASSRFINGILNSVANEVRTPT